MTWRRAGCGVPAAPAAGVGCAAPAMASPQQEQWLVRQQEEQERRQREAANDTAAAAATSEALRNSAEGTEQQHQQQSPMWPAEERREQQINERRRVRLKDKEEFQSVVRLPLPSGATVLSSAGDHTTSAASACVRENRLGFTSGAAAAAAAEQRSGVGRALERPANDENATAPQSSPPRPLLPPVARGSSARWERKLELHDEEEQKAMLLLDVLQQREVIGPETYFSDSSSEEKVRSSSSRFWGSRRRSSTSQRWRRKRSPFRSPPPADILQRISAPSLVVRKSLQLSPEKAAAAAAKGSAAARVPEANEERRRTKTAKALSSSSGNFHLCRHTSQTSTGPPSLPLTPSPPGGDRTSAAVGAATAAGAGVGGSERVIRCYEGVEQQEVISGINGKDVAREAGAGVGGVVVLQRQQTMSPMSLTAAETMRSGSINLPGASSSSPHSSSSSSDSTGIAASNSTRLSSSTAPSSRQSRVEAASRSSSERDVGSGAKKKKTTKRRGSSRSTRGGAGSSLSGAEQDAKEGHSSGEGEEAGREQTRERDNHHVMNVDGDVSGSEIEGEAAAAKKKKSGLSRIKSHVNIFAMFSFVNRVRRQVGNPFFLLLLSVFVLVRGVLYGLSHRALLPYLKGLKQGAGTYQSIDALGTVIWGMMGMVGALSDSVPLGGYQKRYYMLIANVLGVAGVCLLAFTPAGVASANVWIVGLGTFLLCTQVSTLVLMCSGKYSELMDQQPEMKADVVTFVFTCWMAGNLVGTSIVGPVSDAVGPQPLYYLAVPLAAQSLLPILCGCLPEKRLPFRIMRSRLWSNKRFFAMAAAVGVAATGVVILTIWDTSGGGSAFGSNSAAAARAAAEAAAAANNREEGGGSLLMVIYCLLASVALIALCCWCLPGPLARCNLYLFLWGLLNVSISGALDFFYTAKPSCLPDGPHFDYTYYATLISVVGTLASWAGIWIFHSFLSEWTFRQAFWLTIAVRCVASLFDYVMVLRLNVRFLKIPDKFMYLFGDAIIMHLVNTLNHMPGYILTSRLCPKGLESTAYAVMDGMSHIGWNFSKHLGVFATRLAGISTVERPNKPCNFDNLATLTIITQFALPLCAIPLSFFLLPNQIMSKRFQEEQKEPAGAAATSSDGAGKKELTQELLQLSFGSSKEEKAVQQQQQRGKVKTSGRREVGDEGCGGRDRGGGGGAGDGWGGEAAVEEVFRGAAETEGRERQRDACSREEDAVYSVTVVAEDTAGGALLRGGGTPTEETATCADEEGKSRGGRGRRRRRHLPWEQSRRGKRCSSRASSSSSSDRDSSRISERDPTRTNSSTVTTTTEEERECVETAQPATKPLQNTGRQRCAEKREREREDNIDKERLSAVLSSIEHDLVAVRLEDNRDGKQQQASTETGIPAETRESEADRTPTASVFWRGRCQLKWKNQRNPFRKTSAAAPLRTTALTSKKLLSLLSRHTSSSLKTSTAAEGTQAERRAAAAAYPRDSAAAAACPLDTAAAAACSRDTAAESAAAATCPCDTAADPACSPRLFHRHNQYSAAVPADVIVWKRSIEAAARETAAAVSGRRAAAAAAAREEVLWGLQHTPALPSGSRSCAAAAAGLEEEKEAAAETAVAATAVHMQQHVFQCVLHQADRHSVQLSRIEAAARRMKQQEEQQQIPMHAMQQQQQERMTDNVTGGRKEKKSRSSMSAFWWLRLQHQHQGEQQQESMCSHLCCELEPASDVAAAAVLEGAEEEEGKEGAAEEREAGERRREKTAAECGGGAGGGSAWGSVRSVARQLLQRPYVLRSSRTSSSEEARAVEKERKHRTATRLLTATESSVSPSGKEPLRVDSLDSDTHCSYRTAAIDEEGKGVAVVGGEYRGQPLVQVAVALPLDMAVAAAEACCPTHSSNNHVCCCCCCRAERGSDNADPEDDACRASVISSSNSADAGEEERSEAAALFDWLQ